jgi:hypothetical protein
VIGEIIAISCPHTHNFYFALLFHRKTSLQS